MCTESKDQSLLAYSFSVLVISFQKIYSSPAVLIFLVEKTQNYTHIFSQRIIYAITHSLYATCYSE